MVHRSDEDDQARGGSVIRRIVGQRFIPPDHGSSGSEGQFVKVPSLCMNHADMIKSLECAFWWVS